MASTSTATASEERLERELTRIARAIARPSRGSAHAARAPSPHVPRKRLPPPPPEEMARGLDTAMRARAGEGVSAERCLREAATAGDATRDIGEPFANRCCASLRGDGFCLGLDCAAALMSAALVRRVSKALPPRMVVRCGETTLAGGPERTGERERVGDAVGGLRLSIAATCRLTTPSLPPTDSLAPVCLSETVVEGRPEEALCPEPCTDEPCTDVCSESRAPSAAPAAALASAAAGLIGVEMISNATAGGSCCC